MKNTLIGASVILNVVTLLAFVVTFAAHTGQIKALQNKLEDKQDALITLNSILIEQNKANDSCMCYTGQQERINKIRERMKKQEKFDKSK